MSNIQKVGFFDSLKGFFDNIVFKVALVLIMVILIGQTEITVSGSVELKKHKFSVLESIADTVNNTYKGYQTVKKIF